MNFLICDFETTGLVPEVCEIISGCCLLTDGESILEEYTFEAQANNWGKEAEEASQIHRITRERNLMAPPIAEALDQIDRLLEEPATLVCHANPENFGKVYLFDYAVLEMAYHRLDRHWDFRKKIADRWSTLAWYYMLVKDNVLPSPENYRLPTLCREQGIKIGNHHDAKDDTIMAYELFKRLRRIQDEPREGYDGVRIRNRRKGKRGGNSETLFQTV